MPPKRKNAINNNITLPEDIQLEIVSFLPEFVDRYEISKISSEWYQLGQKPNYWKDSIFDFSSLYDSHLILNKEKSDQEQWIRHFCQLAHFCTKIKIDVQANYFFLSTIMTIVPQLMIHTREIDFIFHNLLLNVTSDVFKSNDLTNLKALQKVKIDCSNLQSYSVIHLKLPLSCHSLYLKGMGLATNPSDIMTIKTIKNLYLDTCYFENEYDEREDDDDEWSLEAMHTEIEWEKLTVRNVILTTLEFEEDGYMSFFHFLKYLIPLCTKLKTITCIDCQIDEKTVKCLQKWLPLENIKMVRCYEEY